MFKTNLLLLNFCLCVYVGLLSAIFCTKVRWYDTLKYDGSRLSPMVWHAKVRWSQVTESAMVRRAKVQWSLVTRKCDDNPP